MSYQHFRKSEQSPAWMIPIELFRLLILTLLLCLIITCAIEKNLLFITHLTTTGFCIPIVTILLEVIILRIKYKNQKKTHQFLIPILYCLLFCGICLLRGHSLSKTHLLTICAGIILSVIEFGTAKTGKRNHGIRFARK